VQIAPSDNRSIEEILELEGKYDEDYPWWTSTEKESGEKLRRTKELKKADLAQIVEWKFAALKGRKIRVLRLIAQNSETEIMRIPKKAFALSSNSDSQRVDTLKSLTGIGPALASTILTFYDPEHYGIFDIHVWRELFGKGLADRSILYLIRKRALTATFKVEEAVAHAFPNIFLDVTYILLNVSSFANA
jgi:hypothetical protein